MGNKNSRPKKGQEVKIIAGKYKGQVGKVLSVINKKDRVIIENINIAKKHTKPDKKNPSGGIINKESLETSDENKLQLTVHMLREFYSKYL